MPPTGERRLGATFVGLFAFALVLFLVIRVAHPLFLLFIAALGNVYFCAFTSVIGRHLHLPRPVALTVAVVFTVVAAVGLGILVLPPVLAQGRDLIGAVPVYAERFEAILARLADRYPVLEGTTLGREGGGIVESMIDDGTSFVRGSVVPYLTAGGLLAVHIVSVLAMALYLARDPAGYREGFISLIPPKYRQTARTILADLGNTLRAWIWAQLLAMLVLGVLTAVGLWALRVPYALAFGAFTAAAAIVPFFGTIVSTALPALLVLTLSGWAPSLAVLLLGVGVHVIEANVVAPLIFQERVSIPPVLTILSVLIMASVLGVLGLVVAVPLLAVTLVAVRHILFSQIYGDYGVKEFPAAVLVDQTGERRSVVVP